jgi:hypothetical protein
MMLAGCVGVGLMAVGITENGKISIAAWFAIAVSALFGFTLLACPSSKTLAAMYIIPPIVNNEQVKIDAGEIYKAAVEFVKDGLDKDGEGK